MFVHFVLNLEHFKSKLNCSKAVEAALSGDQSFVEKLPAILKKRHDHVYEQLSAIELFDVIPGDGTFYMFPKVQRAIEKLGLKSDIEFAEYLINEAGVALVPGSAFGLPGYMRLSFAASMEVLDEALKRIRRVVL